MMIYQPRGRLQNHLFYHIYSFLHIEHHLANVLFLDRATCHQPSSPHIERHQCECIIQNHGPYHLSSNHHRYLRQHELVFHGHWLYLSSNIPRRCCRLTISNSLFHDVSQSKCPIHLRIKHHLVK